MGGCSDARLGMLPGWAAAGDQRSKSCSPTRGEARTPLVPHAGTSPVSVLPVLLVPPWALHWGVEARCAMGLLVLCSPVCSGVFVQHSPVCSGAVHVMGPFMHCSPLCNGLFVQHSL